MTLHMCSEPNHHVTVANVNNHSCVEASQCRQLNAEKHRFRLYHVRPGFTTGLDDRGDPKVQPWTVLQPKSAVCVADLQEYNTQR